MPKDVDRAIDHLTSAAESGNQYAQYALGKLYLPEDREEARYWFSESAAQGNEYAQFFLDRWNDQKRPTVMLSVTRLLRHMGEIFRDNSVLPQAPAGQQVDRQLRLKIREKKSLWATGRTITKNTSKPAWPWVGCRRIKFCHAKTKIKPVGKF